MRNFSSGKKVKPSGTAAKWLPKFISASHDIARNGEFEETFNQMPSAVVALSNS